MGDIETIKPIETVYKGYRFRSRLEARWAVFFDAARIKWEYEPEGYDCGGIKYLPDFYLPDLDAHVEVKRDTEEGMAEIEEKSEKAIIWGGDIKQILILSDIPEGRSIDGGMWFFPTICWCANHVAYMWSRFYVAHRGLDDYVDWSVWSGNFPSAYVFCFGARKSIKAVTDVELEHDPEYYQEILTEDTLKSNRERAIKRAEEMDYMVFRAFNKARSARFEHGEKG